VSEEDATLQRAETLIDLDRGAEAEVMVRGLIAQRPDDAAALRLLTQALIAQDRHDEALPIAKRAVAADPDHEQGHRLLAIVFVERHDYRGALGAALEAVRLAPHLWHTHYVLGMARRIGPHHDDPAKALAAAHRAIELAPHESNPHNLAGICYSDMDQPDHAERAYREAIRLDPTNAMALNNLGALGINQGRLSRGTKFLTNALSVQPQDSLMRSNYDVVLLALIRRLYLALIATVVLVLVMGASGADRVPRTITVSVLLTIYAAATYLVARNLPRGSHLWARGLIRRLEWGGRILVIAFVLLTIGVVVMASVPKRLDAGGTLTGVLVFRLIVFASISFAAYRRRRRGRVQRDDWPEWR